MKMVKVLTVILVSLFLVGGTACSNQEAEETGGSVKPEVNETVKNLNDRMHTPLDKAKATKLIGDNRVKEMDKALRNQ